MLLIYDRPATIVEMSGYDSPVFEIGKTLEHYRRSYRKPFPSLLHTKFLYYESYTGKKINTDDGVGGEIVEYVWVILYDRLGQELEPYLIKG
ncbi:hypothetical protein SAMN04488122_0849 [Chitinophaga arvensicola]|uniref:Uncharacterized protein n=1 Tax=Chitinophaga arvensicola TaxID=29529 RepID=A0A1I0PLE6_9BACT|nr:hypothetical protein SAMN04488122_0849 [Chitinophaga arvensicola]